MEARSSYGRINVQWPDVSQPCDADTGARARVLKLLAERRRRTLCA